MVGHDERHVLTPARRHLERLAESAPHRSMPALARQAVHGEITLGARRGDRVETNPGTRVSVGVCRGTSRQWNCDPSVAEQMPAHVVGVDLCWTHLDGERFHGR